MKKKIFLYCILGLLIGNYGFSQVVNIPDKAKNDFSKKHPSATNVKWDNNVTSYMCHYEEKGIGATAHYNMDGTWDFTEKAINPDSVPAVVNDSFSKSKFSDYEVKEKAFVENTKGQSLYRFEVKKGMDKKYLFFDKGGKLVKTSGSI